MNLEDLLTKLEPFDYNKFSSQEAAIQWADEILPLLLLHPNQRHYQMCCQPSHELRYNLSGDRQNSNVKVIQSELRQAINELKIRINENNNLTGRHFSENSQLSVQKSISKLIGIAQNQLWVCDHYLDHLIIDELENISAQEIKILSSNKMNNKETFKNRLKAAQAQLTSKQIEVRFNNSFHDRYFFLDGNEVWHLGTSFNVSAGKKPTSLNKITDDIDKYISEFNKQWHAGNSFPTT